MAAHDLEAEPELARKLATPDYRDLAERGLVLKLHAFGGTAPASLAAFHGGRGPAAVTLLAARLQALEAENARLGAERDVSP